MLWASVVRFISGLSHLRRRGATYNYGGNVSIQLQKLAAAPMLGRLQSIPCASLGHNAIKATGVVAEASLEQSTSARVPQARGERGRCVHVPQTSCYPVSLM